MAQKKKKIQFWQESLKEENLEEKSYHVLRQLTIFLIIINYKHSDFTTSAKLSSLRVKEETRPGDKFSNNTYLMGLDGGENREGISAGF